MAQILRSGYGYKRHDTALPFIKPIQAGIQQLYHLIDAAPLIPWPLRAPSIPPYAYSRFRRSPIFLFRQYAVSWRRTLNTFGKQEAMPTIQIEAQVSTEQLLRAVEQMAAQELEAFVARVLTLRAQREAPHLPPDESALLLKINQAIPPDLQQRYDELIAKRRTETLTPDEYAELLQLTDRVEQLEAERVGALATLAQVRHVSVTELMQTLGLPLPAYV